MNVILLTPDRVGSTLLQRVLTVYMLRKKFDKPVINLHELTNGLEKYYNNTLQQEVLGKPRGTEWGYYQTLSEIENLLKSVDHYKTSRLARYHIVSRQDTIAEQLKFYDYINKNFYIISCRRENLFEHAISWGIQGHSKRLNVYNAEEKINVFHNIYRNGITLLRPSFCNYLNDYKQYINWTNTYFNVQSIWNYDTDIQDIEKYILNLDFMKHSNNNTWKDMFGQNFDTWNACHRMLPNLQLSDRPDAIKTFEMLDIKNKNLLSNIIKNDPTDISVVNENTFSMTDNEFSFLEKNIKSYIDTAFQLQTLVNKGFLVTPIPLKLQSLKEKKLIVKNYNECIDWYNEWVKENNFGKLYTKEELDIIMIAEDQKLNFELYQQNLLQ
jgi:hypothetical protein